MNLILYKKKAFLKLLMKFKNRKFKKIILIQMMINLMIMKKKWVDLQN